MLLQRFKPFRPTRRFMCIPFFLNKNKSKFKHFNQLLKVKKSYKNLNNISLIQNLRKMKHYPYPLISKIPNFNLRVTSVRHVTQKLTFKSFLLFQNI